MKRFKHFSLYSFSVAVLILYSAVGLAQETILFSETFDRCIDEEDENYGYTGGNDNLWGGDIAKAQVIYTDNKNEWSFNYCNGAYQCLKVGTTKQGSASTPIISYKGDAILTCRVAPWEGDSLFNISISGGSTTDPTAFQLKQHQWTTITVRISDITGNLKITFSSLYKHRFFLDDVYVRAADPNAGAIRTDVGSMLDFGILGSNYSAQQRTLTVSGTHLSGSIAAAIQTDADNLFSVSPTTLPAEGGQLTVTCRAGASQDRHGAFLVLTGKDANTGAEVQKIVTLIMEATYITLEGSGTKPDPYTVGDVLKLAKSDGTVWVDEYYWCTGYILGAAKRYTNTYQGINDQFDGITLNDSLSLVLAAKPTETDTNYVVTVQIGQAARKALNIVSHPEFIGRKVKINGILLNQSLSPNYLGHTGIKRVYNEDQYEILTDEPQALKNQQSEPKNQKILRDGQLLIRVNDNLYSITGQKVQ